ncbi:MAG: F0F1 ATP synthase subunit delta [Anaerolineae bacterium]|jgi:F-type H+-transporting ATPase subunit b|nr:F0F1 ATP synthase subunit delta [Anaerolineae bacterium]MDH7474232.1 F0F1 ATP synthase subunit delta [Anaerolineae bacterium]
MLDLSWATVIFQIANFLLLVLLLNHFLFQPVMRRVAQRKAEKERLLQELNQEREEAARLRAEWEARLARAEEEAAALIAQAQEKAETERLALLQEAQVEVARILAEAHADTHQQRRLAIDSFHDELLDAILEISGQVIARTAPPEMHDSLVKQLNDRIWELGRSQMQRVEAFRRSLGTREPTAHVTTAHPLSPEQQGLLVRTLTALADRHVNLELRIDPSLAVGLQVRLGDTIVDNSIAGQLAGLREQVSAALKERMGNGQTDPSA